MAHPEDGPVGEVVKRLEQHFGTPPDTAVVLGSGLSLLLDKMTIEKRVPYPDLALPGSAVIGHAGEAVLGTLGDTRMLAMAGRVHFYEGWEPAELVRGVRALSKWGVGQIVFTCSAGGITEEMEPGTLALISDHLNFQGTSPLLGPTYGDVRFPDMSTAYDPRLRNAVREAAASLDLNLESGIYAAMMGPAYETPAEIQMLKTVGASLVGMSTVPEILAAAGCGFPAVAIAMVSNKAAGITGNPLTHEEVTETAQAAAGHFAALIEASIARF
ncbi:MAG: purine-nucleoside phosphorylase [Proteobacteria bacterium]|nr:purine-nucleoside phosphorylase [Pseudomonadota bacterium]